MNRVLGLVLLGVLVSSPVLSVSAATLYMDPSSSNLARGDAQIISVRIDTDEAQDECINAVEGVLRFEGPVNPIDVSLGNSIFSIWVERPTISANGREVTFAGGIPNGYCGRIEGDPRLTNNLFDVIVRTEAIAPENNQAVIATATFTDQTIAYLNDGLGTVAQLTLLPKSITVQPELSQAVLDPWRELVAADTIDPQEFSIQLAQQPFDGRYYIVFNTTDKQTGIDRYEVIEEPISQFAAFTWGQATAPWVEARSPYILRDQSLNTIIRVKAIDKAGNEYIASYIPDKALRTTPNVQVALYILLAVSVLVLAYGAWNYTRRQRMIREEQSLARYTESVDPEMPTKSPDQVA